ncbi:hypothetical protein [Mesorhizobium salmacidum]|uniref:Uncharacterized protein n=1 Tax=Mesorhizobium salmacidum TaxID=3015171 RepID=A0ABU8L1L9_9HYPH
MHSPSSHNNKLYLVAAIESCTADSRAIDVFADTSLAGIAPLTDPKAHGLDESIAFDLVVPSLPGFGFSSPMTSPGWDSARTAKAWDTLMKGLGYERYGAHGGDAGALVGRELGILAPEGLVGTHLLQIFAFPSGKPGEMEKLSPFEMEGMANLANFEKYAGYQPIQSKRPGTLAFALIDSPVGQLAWNGNCGSASKVQVQTMWIANAI